jgi:hypothetical protein
MSEELSRMSENKQAHITLPQPRIWKPEHLADFFGFSVHWVYKQTRKDSPDPPPRCKGFRLIRFDSQSAEFQEWILRQLACYSVIEEEQNGV